MMRRANQRWMAIALPVGAGVAILALGLFLMPSTREVEQAERRAIAPAAPIVDAPDPIPVATPAPVPTHPELAAALKTGDAATLAALTATLIEQRVPVTTAQVAYDLVASGRPAVALAYLAARPDGAAPAHWPLRIETLRKLDRRAEAEALLVQA